MRGSDAYGPSNVGNDFAARRIDATCGFGIAYESFTSRNEPIKRERLRAKIESYCGSAEKSERRGCVVEASVSLSLAGVYVSHMSFHRIVPWLLVPVAALLLAAGLSLAAVSPAQALQRLSPCANDLDDAGDAQSRGFGGTRAANEPEFGHGGCHV